jgi:hypothetical protein
VVAAVPAAYQYWKVSLMLAEMDCTDKLDCTRRLDISAQGVSLLRNFSIANSTALQTATTLSFVVLVSSGSLNVQVKGVNSQAVYNGLLVQPATCNLAGASPAPASPSSSPVVVNSPSPPAVRSPSPAPASSPRLGTNTFSNVVRVWSDSSSPDGNFRFPYPANCKCYTL